MKFVIQLYKSILRHSGVHQEPLEMSKITAPTSRTSEPTWLTHTHVRTHTCSMGSSGLQLPRNPCSGMINTQLKSHLSKARLLMKADDFLIQFPPSHQCQALQVSFMDMMPPPASIRQQSDLVPGSNTILLLSALRKAV